MNVRLQDDLPSNMSTRNAAQIRNVIVDLFPVTVGPDGKIDFPSPIAQIYRFEAATLPEIIVGAKAYAAGYGQPCMIGVRLDGNHRKPPGFDDAFSDFSYANIPNRITATEQRV